jgi:hypothetical protein
MSMLWLKLMLAAAAGVLLTRQLLAARHAERVRRRHMLDAFLPRLKNPRLKLGRNGWPVVHGELDGHALTLMLVPDSLAYRTLPRLWLEARWTRPHRARLRLLLRPAGGECPTDGPDWSHRLVGPSRWKVPVEASGSGPEALPLLHQLETVDLAAYPALKQLLVSESDLRLALRCAEADRGAYRVLRAAAFECGPVAEPLVEETLAALRGIEEAFGSRERVRAAS